MRKEITMRGHAQLRGMWLSVLGAVMIAGTIAGCGQGASGTPAQSPGAEALVPWNSPFGKGWSSGNGPKQPPVTVASVTRAEQRLAGRKLPFQIRTLPGLGQPFRVMIDPWANNSSVHRVAVALQYHTPHGLADVIELYPGTTEKAFERQSRSDVNFMNATSQSGTTVTHSGHALIVYAGGRYFGFMTLGSAGAAVTLAWQQGTASYLIDGPSLGKSYCLQLAGELASQ